jgi:hypothetical protein
MERQNKRQRTCQLQRQRRLLHENPRLRVSEEECFYIVEERPSSSSSSFYLPTTTTTQQYENENGKNVYVPEICVHPTVRWRVAETDEAAAAAAAIIDDDGEFEAAESTATIPTTPVPVFYYANELIRPTIMTITKTRTRTNNNNNNNNNHIQQQQEQEQEQQEDEKKYEHSKWMYYSREIIFELLGKNDDGYHTPKHTEQEVAKMMSRAVYTTNVGSHLVFENDYCRLWDFSIRPGGGNRSNDLHHHVLPYAFVFLQHGKLRIYKPATTTTTTARNCNNNDEHEHDDEHDDEHEIVVEEDKEQTGDNDTDTRTCTCMNNNTEYVGVMERQSGEVIWSPIANGGFELDEEQKVVEEDDVENGDGTGTGNSCEKEKINNKNKNCRSKKWCWKPSIPTAVHSVENDLADSTFREYMIEIK